MKWERVSGDFEWDGSLRDIYVPGTTLPDWDLSSLGRGG